MRNRTMIRYTVSIIPTALLLLLALSSCRMEPPIAAEADEEMATLKITVPQFAPWLTGQIGDEKMKPKAWLGGDRIEFGLYEETAPTTLVDYEYVYDELGSWPSDPLVTEWIVPPGDYFVRSWVFNENSNLYLDYGYASTWGIYPEQDILNPTNFFNIAAGEGKSILITNFPTLPDEIGNAVWPAETTYYEPQYGEKWISFTTGPTDTSLYVWVGAYSVDGVNSGDVGLYLFGSNGIFIAMSAYLNTNDPSTPEEEELDSYYDGFTVESNATYYAGVYAWEISDFEIYFESY